MSAPAGDVVSIRPDPEARTVSAPDRPGGPPRPTGRRRLLPLVLATTLATLALTAAGTSAASAATPDPVLGTWGRDALPVPDELQHTDVVAVDGGGSQALALTSAGKVVSWGDSYGRPPASLQDETVTAISAGSSHSLAVTADGRIVGWGRDDNGEAVLPSYLARWRYAAVSAGGRHSLGLTTEGEVRPWGDGSSGQTALPRALDGKRVIQVAAGSADSLALSSDGQVTAWGHGFTEGQYTVPALQDQTVVAIAAASDASVALTSEGRVIGFGPEARYSDVPAAAQSNIVAIAGGGDDGFIALTADHQVVAWEFDPDPSTALSRPVPVPAGVANSRVSLIGVGDGFDLTVGVPNSPPTAGDQQLSTAYQQPVDVTLTATNEDDSDLTFTVRDQPRHGALTGKAPNLTYTPAKRYSGTDSFTYVVSDGNVESEPAAVSVTVGTPPSAIPTAKDESVQTPSGTAAPVTLSAEDPDSDGLRFAVQDGPQHGTLTGTAPDLTYTPEKGYSGQDSFTYTASDAISESAPATVSIEVLGAPAPPPDVTPPTKQFVVDTNGLHHSRSITSKKVTVAKNDELLVAFVSANGPTGKAQSITKVTGGGLEWSLVERGNARVGTSEVWQAHASQAQDPFRVKASFARSGYSSKITVAGFVDASTAGGATAHASGRRSAPSVTLTPQATNSVVWAAGRAVGERYDPRPGTGTRIVHDVGISDPRVGYWVQKASARTVAGKPVTISDNIATSKPWGLTAVEIRGQVYL